MAQLWPRRHRWFLVISGVMGICMACLILSPRPGENHVMGAGSELWWTVKKSTRGRVKVITLKLKWVHERCWYLDYSLTFWHVFTRWFCFIMHQGASWNLCPTFVAPHSAAIFSWEPRPVAESSLRQADPQNLRPRCWELSHILLKPDAKKGMNKSWWITWRTCGNLLQSAASFLAQIPEKQMGVWQLSGGFWDARWLPGAFLVTAEGQQPGAVEKKHPRRLWLECLASQKQEHDPYSRFGFTTSGRRQPEPHWVAC